MTIDKRPQLADDQMCFGCGPKNSRGLRLKFDLNKEARRIYTRWTPSKEFQGYADIVHGGMIGLVLDELMVNLLWTLQWPAVTADLTIRFKKPAKVGVPLDCEAWVEDENGRLFLMQAEAKTSDGTVVAAASAKCVRLEGYE